MDPTDLARQAFALGLAVALMLFALNVGTHMIGFGKSFVRRLTRKVLQGVAIIVGVLLLLALLAESLSR